MNLVHLIYPYLFSATLCLMGPTDTTDVQKCALPIDRPNRTTLQGKIDDIFTDELDDKTTYLSLSTPFKRYCCSIPTELLLSVDAGNLIDAEVSLSGILRTQGFGLRRHIDNLIVISSVSDIHILKPPQTDPSTIPPLSDLNNAGADTISKSGRRSVEGYVKVTWGHNTFFITTITGENYLVYLQWGATRQPKRGDFIHVVGLPETDLFHLNLTRATWKPATPTFPQPVDTPIVVTDPETLSFRQQGNPNFQIDYTGKTLKLHGIVRDMPSGNPQNDCLYLICGKSEHAFIAGNGQRPFDNLKPGCTAEITCVGFLKTGIWTYTDPTPHIKGYLFVVRDASDVVILSNPPWLTPSRMLLAIFILSLFLAGVFIRNRILQRIIDRKSRQLLKVQVAQIKSELRVDERTHLAVELHDTLSQNLSGVACQIAATKGTLPEGADETARYLETAERMLLSCRTELRRCLWDLRCDTLEEANFTEAIRKTLAPVVIGVETIIRFNVPRSRLSDTTAHAVLCIVRELAANAVRHGKAKALRIAGEFHDGCLSFSVRDNGLGFDPLRCEGPAEGHFGLEGIRERIKRLSGTFTLSAEPGKGTRAEVSIMSIPSQCDDANS